jgi:ferric-dicitrate binding protein FerR (iron transport regulator)
MFRQAGAREKPASGDELAARVALHAEWRQITAGRKRRRVLAGLAVAATVLLAMGAVIRVTGVFFKPEPLIQLAEVENLVGTALVHLDTGEMESERLGPAGRLSSQQAVATGESSAVALRWVHGQSIRLDEGTRIRLDSADMIRLEQGRIYVDTGRQGNATDTLTISTPTGQVRHVGTQFMTAVPYAGTTVSVRSGRVALDLSGAEHLVAGGEQMTVSSGGQRSRQQIETWGEPWRWAERVTPPFDSDGKTIWDLVAWVASETGLKVEYASSGAENWARQTILRGKLELEPMKALDMMTQTSGMEAQVSEGLITLSLAGEG